ncbi:unnamed protein product [Schistocephalus solidus]|uniref:BTB domain-containing protein n=1 Tax=Schistocephalus solidus TaxID=70667 RepID=A0A183TQ95_SCHSO|nr:unnamed protein product [Schistocephalus solidus]
MEVLPAAGSSASTSQATEVGKLHGESPFFEAFSTGGLLLAEEKFADVTINILSYTYAGVVHVSMEEIQQLLLTARLLGMEPLSIACCNFILQR